LRGGKDGFSGFHGNVNIKQPLLYYFPSVSILYNIILIILHNILTGIKGSNIIMVV